MRTSLRENFTSALESEGLLTSIQWARQLIEDDDSLRQWSFVARSIEKFPDLTRQLKTIRVALLSSFSIEFIQLPLIARSFLNGLRLEIYQSGFAQYRQELLDPGSGLYNFHPDVVVLAVDGADLAPALYRDYLDLRDSVASKLAAQVIEDVASLVASLRRRSQAMVLLHGLVPPLRPQLGILDGHSDVGQHELVNQINNGFLELARRTPNLYIVNCAGLAAELGESSWNDPRMAHYARAPIARDAMPRLALEYTKYFRAIAGLNSKCLVLDLDNTLWGGILGEDGVDGIALGPNYPGSAFVEFQTAVLNLSKRGVILAIASKNNSIDVDEVFEKHPFMVLKKDHFSHWEIHWQPKSESLRNIASTLGIGLEHMVFADDNPVEIDEVRMELPAVKVLQLPRQPERYVELLNADGLFDSLSYSSEDRSRREMYKQRSQAEQIRSQASSLEDFYHNLEMIITILPADDSSIARTAQLTQKTNQFNLTTRRYTENEIISRVNDADWLVLTVQVSDKFGDNGIVGVVMAKQVDKLLDIDSFLLSCRVIGRTIETGIIAYLCDYAREHDICRLRGLIIPTKKNIPARDLFERHGFEKTAAASSTNGEYWELDLDAKTVACPEWMRMVLPTKISN